MTSILVLAIVAILNFIGGHNPVEIDFTKNKIHAFSDQSTKVLNSLNSDLKADFYGDFATKENYAPLFENYQKLSPFFIFEAIDPFKEPTRVRVAGVSKADTLVLTYQGRSLKVNELTEAKITNAIIKLKKENKSTVCALVGQGELSVEDITQNGFHSLKIALEDQSYVVKEISISEKNIPKECNALIILGPTQIFYPKEIEALTQYLNQGGSAVIGISAILSKKEELPLGFRSLLSKWGINIREGLIIDPDAKKMGVDASLVPISFYNPHHEVTHDSTQSSYFPFARPIEFNLTVPTGFVTESLAKTNENAWAEFDIQSFIQGKAQYNSLTDLKGPLSVAVASEGRSSDPKTLKRTRLVVMGSSQLVNNQYSRLGGNLDFFLNTVSWVLEDESLISIRPKLAESGKVELSENAGGMVFMLIVVIFPSIFVLFGFLLWLRRKSL